MDIEQKVLNLLYEQGFTDKEIINWLDELNEGDLITVDFKERKVISSPVITQQKEKQASQIKEDKSSSVETIAKAILENNVKS